MRYSSTWISHNVLAHLYYASSLITLFEMLSAYSISHNHPHSTNTITDNKSELVLRHNVTHQLCYRHLHYKTYIQMNSNQATGYYLLRFHQKPHQQCTFNIFLLCLWVAQSYFFGKILFLTVLITCAVATLHLNFSYQFLF